MVSIRQVRTSNAALTEDTAPRTAVFVGGTSGIGKATLAALVNLKLPVKVYVVGRKSIKAAMGPFLDELREINPKADLIWVEGEVSLLSEVKRICDDIKSREEAIDLLFLSTGYVQFSGRNSKHSSLSSLP